MTAVFVDPVTGAWQDTAVDADDAALTAALGGGAGGLSTPRTGPTRPGRRPRAARACTPPPSPGAADLREAAERGLVGALPLVRQAPRFAGWWLAVTAAALDGPREVAVVGDAEDPARAELHRVALRAPAPGLVVSVGSPGAQRARAAAGPSRAGRAGDGLRVPGVRLRRPDRRRRAARRRAGLRHGPPAQRGTRRVSRAGRRAPPRRSARRRPAPCRRGRSRGSRSGAATGRAA